MYILITIFARIAPKNMSSNTIFFISGQKAQTAVKAQLQQLAVNARLHTIKRAKMETLCAQGAILLNSLTQVNDKWLTTATACQRVSKTKSLVCMEGQSALEPEVLPEP